MADTIDIKVSQDLVKPIIEEKMKAAIVEALGSGKEIIEQVVDRILKDKVGSDGQKSRYDSDNKYTFIDMTLRNAIQESCKESLKEFVAQYKEQIKAEIERQLKTKKGMDKFSAALMDGLLKATMENWRLQTTFNFASPKDY